MSKASPVILLSKRKCHFCKLKENNKLKYGPLYGFKNIVAHYYCVLLSTRMKQNGEDNEGIMGFLFNDINLELKRSKRISCVYCQQKNATVECAHPGCRKVFHYPCGLRSGALARFRNDFLSFCYQHRPKQKVPKKILNEVANTELICAICYETVEPNNRIDNLWAPCCLKTWYHRNCVQNLAHSSGYFFRCATCNDTEKFKSHMEDNGIFVPQQDASWELVPNAYEELLVRHGRCDAEKCICPKGREENVEDTRWEITLCRFCGSQGIHVGCGSLKFTDPQWECTTCQSIMKTDSNTKLEEEFKDDLTFKKCPPKSNDQSAGDVKEKKMKNRKRKLSGQQEVADKRKKERVDGGDSSDDDTDHSDVGRKSSDEFYIRIPGRKSDKPHTITKPDEESDEEVDVITVDTAWLMVEEVLSRVKPGPLSFKLRHLRKRCFAYHFDPFDIREEEIDIINLASDSEDDSSVKESECDSDIEIIAEVVRSESDKEEVVHKLKKMDPSKQCDQSQQMPEIPEELETPAATAMSDVSEGSERPEEPEIFEILDESEGAEIPKPPEAPSPPRPLYATCFSDLPRETEILPSTSYEREFISSMQRRSRYYFDIDIDDDDEDENDVDMEYVYGAGNSSNVNGPEQEQKMDESIEGGNNEGENVEEQTQRLLGKKHPAQGLQYCSKAKKARTTAESDNSVVHTNDQGQMPMVSAQIPSSSHPPEGSWQSTNQESLGVADYPMEQASEENPNVIRSVDVSGFSMADPAPMPPMFITNPPLFLLSSSNNTTVQSLYGVPMAATSVRSCMSVRPSTSPIPTTLEILSTSENLSTSATPSSSAMPSTSAKLFTSEMPSMSSVPSMSAMLSRSGMPLTSTMPSTSAISLTPAMPSAPEMPSTSVATSPSKRTFELSMYHTSAMTSTAETTGKPSTFEVESFRNDKNDDSGSLTPLPSFQFLSSLQPGISPLPSSVSSNSSNSVSLPPHRACQVAENSSSSEGSNDVFMRDNESQKSTP